MNVHKPDGWDAIFRAVQAELRALPITEVHRLCEANFTGILSKLYMHCGLTPRILTALAGQLTKDRLQQAFPHKPRCTSPATRPAIKAAASPATPRLFDPETCRRFLECPACRCVSETLHNERDGMHRCQRCRFAFTVSSAECRR